jgi:hypothetical protein
MNDDFRARDEDRAWVGWLKPAGGSWRRAVTAPTRSLAMQRLNDVALRHLERVELAVLSAGEEPSDDPPWVRRRRR